MPISWVEKQRLGSLLRGTFLNLGHPLTARMAAQMGFDWLLLDLEHGALDEGALPGLMMAIEGSGSAPIVRVVSNHRDPIKRALDLGAAGVMVPYVSSAAEARDAVAATRYPPQGCRGVAGATFSTRFGLATEEYHAETNAKVLTIVQIETQTGVRNAAEIAAVEGVDVLFVGPLDLSFNLGCPKQFDHPDEVEAIEQVVVACREHGKAAGILSSPESLAARVEQGFTFVAVGSEAGALASGLAQLRDA